MADPERANALGPEMVSQLRAALRASTGAGAVVLAADGRHFCSGGDHDELAALERQHFRAYLADLLGLFADLASSPVPVISSIQGAAVGGGVEMVLQTDFIVASEQAWLQLPQVQSGGRIGEQTFTLLLARCGLPFTRRFTLLGERVPAVDAAHSGLVDDVAPAGEATARALQLAARLDAQPAEALWRARGVVASDLRCADALRAEERRRLDELAR